MVNSDKQHKTTPITCVPVMQPLLPSADRLLPYLERIDQTRLYSNFGPLNEELAGRLADQFRVDRTAVVCAGSGTAALMGAILSTAGRATADKPIAIVPAFTFVATALAAEMCGYEVRFCDVDPVSWQMGPETVASVTDPDRIGLVLPVAPFGRPVEQKPWLEFRSNTEIPVAIDGAACFELVQQEPTRFLGEIPLAMSFHATKSFATGEGGCIVVKNAELAKQAVQRLNFGFFETRECESFSLNGKMSEYHAAVGLAEFDGWSAKQAALNKVSSIYCSLFSARGEGDKIVCAPDICSSYMLFVAGSAQESSIIEDRLSSAGIGFRHWYGRNLNRQAYFELYQRAAMPVSESLSKRVLGLPVAPDMDDRVIHRVVDVITGGHSHELTVRQEPGGANSTGEPGH